MESSLILPDWLSLSQVGNYVNVELHKNERFPFLTFDLTLEQRKSIESLCAGYDTLTIIPTGGGKTLVMFLTPWFSDKFKERKSVSLIISPLDALMTSMINRYSNYGFECFRLQEIVLENDQLKDAYTKCTSHFYVFSSVEVLFKTNLLNKLQQVFRINFIHVDEAHCVVQWGDHSNETLIFRRYYQKLSTLRCLLEEKPPLSLLTATLEGGMVKRLKQLSGFSTEDGREIVSSPYRNNIYLDVRQVKRELKLLNFIVDDLAQTDCDPFKTLVYVDSIDDIWKIYYYIQQELTLKLGHPIREPRPFTGFHALVGEKSKAFVLSEFVKPNSHIRVIICTNSFGMGIDVGDIRRVVLFGKPLNALDCMQKIGRAGRDGRPSQAILFYFASPFFYGNNGSFNLKFDKCHHIDLLEKTYKNSLRSLSHLQHDPVCKGRMCNCSACNCCTFCRNACPCYVLRNPTAAPHDETDSEKESGSESD